MLTYKLSSLQYIDYVETIPDRLIKSVTYSFVFD